MTLLNMNFHYVSAPLPLYTCGECNATTIASISPTPTMKTQTLPNQPTKLTLPRISTPAVISNYFTYKESPTFKTKTQTPTTFFSTYPTVRSTVMSSLHQTKIIQTRKTGTNSQTEKITKPETLHTSPITFTNFNIRSATEVSTSITSTTSHTSSPKHDSSRVSTITGWTKLLTSIEFSHSTSNTTIIQAITNSTSQSPNLSSRVTETRKTTTDASTIKTYEASRTSSIPRNSKPTRALSTSINVFESITSTAIRIPSGKHHLVFTS